MLRHAMRRGANLQRRRFSEAAAVSAPPKVPQPPVPPPDDDAALTPRKICDELDTHIVGQDAAKRAVAIALRNRWRRQLLGEELRAEVVPKNILMIGPTGCGIIGVPLCEDFTPSNASSPSHNEVGGFFSFWCSAQARPRSRGGSLN